MQSFNCFYILLISLLSLDNSNRSLSTPLGEASKTYGSPRTNSFSSPVRYFGLRWYEGLLNNLSVSQIAHFCFSSLKILHRLKPVDVRSNTCRTQLSRIHLFFRYCQINNTIRILFICWGRNNIFHRQAWPYLEKEPTTKITTTKIINEQGAEIIIISNNLWVKTYQTKVIKADFWLAKKWIATIPTIQAKKRIRGGYGR